jgi:hypothetical protein
MFFSRDGRYGIFGQQGTFSIENGRLRTRLTHQINEESEESNLEWLPIGRPITDTAPVGRESPNRMILTLDGRRVHFIRCVQANYEFLGED